MTALSERHSEISSGLLRVETWTPAATTPDIEFDYIDIASIDRDQKAITTWSRIAAIEAPSRARQIVRTSDVLVSTVRPNLNAVAFVPLELDGATASTGFCVLRCDPHVIEPRYLFHWVRSPQFVAAISRQATGASYPAVTDRMVKGSRMPMPAPAEQRRIAAILDKADTIRQTRMEGIHLTEELLRSTFLQMFGDPATNPKMWSMRNMGDVIKETQYGTSDKSNSDEIGVPVLRMNNITYGGDIDLADVKWCEIKEADLAKYTVRRGDLLFNRTNSPELVGKTAVWDRNEPYAYAGYLFRVRFDEGLILPAYVSAFLNSGFGKKMLFAKAKPSNNMSNFSAGEFRRIEVPVPDLALQRRFAAAVVQIKNIKRKRMTALAESTALLSSLVQRAFRGEL